MMVFIKTEVDSHLREEDGPWQLNLRVELKIKLKMGRKEFLPSFLSVVDFRVGSTTRWRGKA